MYIFVIINYIITRFLYYNFYINFAGLLRASNLNILSFTSISQGAGMSKQWECSSELNLHSKNELEKNSHKTEKERRLMEGSEQPLMTGFGKCMKEKESELLRSLGKYCAGSRSQGGELTHGTCKEIN